MRVSSGCLCKRIVFLEESEVKIQRCAEIIFPDTNWRSLNLLKFMLTSLLIPRESLTFPQLFRCFALVRLFLNANESINKSVWNGTILSKKYKNIKHLSPFIFSFYPSERYFTRRRLFDCNLSKFTSRTREIIGLHHKKQTKADLI